MRGILKRHEVSDFSFQITIEKLVWKMIKASYIRSHYLHTEQEELAFRIFCIFNRFCETDTVPMTLSPQGQYLIYSWLSIAEPEKQFTASFGNVLANITRRKDPYLIVATKKYYDEYVRDILIEDRLTYKTKRVIVKNGSNHPKIGIIA